MVKYSMVDNLSRVIAILFAAGCDQQKTTDLPKDRPAEGGVTHGVHLAVVMKYSEVVRRYGEWQVRANSR